jgi:hypothetical protein
MTVLATNIKPRYKATHAAYLFTKQREAEIGGVEEEISYLVNIKGSADSASPNHCIHRIIAREQADLAELRRGWKIVKEGGQ